MGLCSIAAKNGAQHSIQNGFVIEVVGLTTVVLGVPTRVKRNGSDEQTKRTSQESRMTRHLFYAITLIGTGMFLASSAEAVTAARCEDRGANCVGTCADYTGGAGDVRGHQNVCMRACDRQTTRCLIRAHAADERWPRERQ